MNKKGQWAHAMARERRSAERVERIIQTCYLKNEGFSVENIALDLGVGSETVRGYLREIESNEGHYESIVKQRLEELKEQERERIRKLTRTNKEICLEEIGSALKWTIIISFIALLGWWVPSIVFYVATAGNLDITNWVYSWTGFPIFMIITFSIIFLIKVSKEIQRRDEYTQQNPERDLSSKQESRIIDGEVLIECPKCSTKKKIKDKDLPKINEKNTFTCSKCGAILTCSLPKQNYLCKGCRKSLKSIPEKYKHQKECPEFKERTFKCNKCNTHIILDNSEFMKLKKNGDIKVNCPNCNNQRTIKLEN